jgi:hypothetical protein
LRLREVEFSETREFDKCKQLLDLTVEAQLRHQHDVDPDSAEDEFPTNALVLLSTNSLCVKGRRPDITVAQAVRPGKTFLKRSEPL